jgi:hypothetical protein
MTFALVTPGGIRELSRNRGFTGTDDNQHPASVLRLWERAKLREVGVYPIQDQDRPEDAVVIGHQLTLPPKSAFVVREWLTRQSTADELLAHARSLRDAARKVTRVTIERRDETLELDVDSDREDESSLLGLKVAMATGELPEPFTFKAGGVSRLVTHDEFRAIAAAVQSAIMGAYNQERLAQEAIEDGSATTPAEVGAVFRGER